MSDLKVVTEDLVVSNFQGTNTGSIAFHRLQVRDPLPGVTGHLDHSIELFWVSSADDTGVLQGGRGILSDRFFQQVKYRLADVEVLQDGL